VLAAALLVPVTAGCGKKGDPMPPLPRGPNAVSDLAVEQEGAEAVLTFSYPDRLMNGEPLRDVSSIEIYRVPDPSPAIAPAKPPAAHGPAPAGDEAPGSAARREAANVRLAEEAFYKEAKRVDALPVTAIAERTRVRGSGESGEGAAPRSGSDDGDPHPRRTRSMITGVPSSSKRSRRRFSTQ
jgi:hypothetical protein